MDNNNCLECGYEYTKDKYCEICGTERINYCSGTHLNNSDINYTKPCNDPLSSEARYCSICGASSTFFEEKLLHAWYEPAALKDLQYRSPYKLLPSRHSLIEHFEEALTDREQGVTVRMEQYLHSVMYPSYKLLDEHVKNEDMKNLTSMATKLTTTLLLSFVDGYNTDYTYYVENYKENSYPFGKIENQIKVREILSDSIKKIDDIYPDVTT